MRFREGAGRMCLDYLRTLRHGTMEELPDAAAVAAWVEQFGPLDSVPVPSEGGYVEEARRLRESIRALIDSARQGIGSPASARQAVNAAAALPPPSPALAADGRVVWHAGDPIGATLSLIARDALDLTSSPLLARVRQCAGADCGALFVDTSRPGVRRWCSMNTCGNRAKKEAMKTRHVD
ncbi:CGNR zinc finger domain-containing protein [Nocardia sp. CA-129566]|uniref:CGNR zinc finger domain-containing protein n=1 Tax=Nocardia sp. CA-129566 TaxID=3239976 RepID=UPI003D950FEC